MNITRSARWFVFAVLVLAFSTAAFSQVFVSVRIGPPALPVYAQPICPGPGYFWTPGYWAWNDDAGYYWVPGTWVVAPVGMLWTPGYWGWGGGFYAWHPGYWGPHIGFYGGINYGFGYGGVGFVGGEWRGGAFFYNRSVTNVNVTNVTNVYNKTVIVNNNTVNRVSFNGGEGGVVARATPAEESAAREPHTAALATQTQHEQAASQNKDLFASNNHGAPKVAATTRPGEFSGHGVVKAQAAGAPYHAPAISPKEARVASTSAPNHAAGNTQAANHTVTPANSKATSNSNGGFKPFTPPNKNEANGGHSGSMNNNRAENTSRPQHESRPAPQPHQAAPKANPPKQNAPPKQGQREEHHRGR